jgi:hypothetical protein
VAAVERVGDRVRVSLDTEESGVLAGLALQVRDLLDGDVDRPPEDSLDGIVPMSSTPVAAPDDPAVRRLLPDAYAEAPAAGEFRRLMDAELRATKADALRQLVDDVAKGAVDVELDAERVDAWLRALTDVRLVIGTRLDIDEDTMSRRLDPDDPRLPLFVVYDWLTALQDRLVDAVAGP